MKEQQIAQWNSRKTVNIKNCKNYIKMVKNGRKQQNSEKHPDIVKKTLKVVGKMLKST